MENEATRSANPGPAELAVGDRIGHYRIVQQLGEGGMGRVFQVEEVMSHTQAALKVLRPDLAQRPEVARRFLREARVAAALRHPNIVRVYGYGEHQGRMYYLMELLTGHNLGRLRELEGCFSLERALSYARQIAAALRWMHGHQIVHRDLTPENVFVVGQSHETVKVFDFGIAKLAEPSAIHGPGTQLGTILGTPEFMSPEQAGGRPVDSRTDLYSLGLIMYWMLTDQVPFSAGSFGEIVARREREEIPALPDTTASGQAIPKHVRQAVMECLARDPSERPQRAEDLLGRLSPPVPVSHPRRHRRDPAWPGVVISISAGVAVGCLVSMLGLEVARHTWMRETLIRSAANAPVLVVPAPPAEPMVVPPPPPAAAAPEEAAHAEVPAEAPPSQIAPAEGPSAVPEKAAELSVAAEKAIDKHLDSLMVPVPRSPLTPAPSPGASATGRLVASTTSTAVPGAHDRRVDPRESDEADTPGERSIEEHPSPDPKPAPMDAPPSE